MKNFFSPLFVSPARLTLIGGLLITSGLLSPGPVSAQDGHIDPAARAVRHSLTITRHVDTNFALATASGGLQTATSRLQACLSQVSNDQDVACQVTVETAGSLNSFGTAGDGGDFITSAQELNDVFDETSGHIKIVSGIGFCGGPAPPGFTIAGCARTPGSSLIVGSGRSALATGQILLHEFGHNQGLNHRGSPGAPVMSPVAGTNLFEVDLVECGSFHAGGADAGPKRPVDIGFIVDDTGSMSEEISGVRTALTRVIDGAATASGCEAFSLTTFKDTVTERPATTNLSTIRSQVSGLVALGGGDCPEASVAGVLAAEPNIKNNGRAFIFTDAAPHPGTDLTAAVSALRARGIRIDVLLTGDCVFADLGAGIAASSNEPASPAGGFVKADLSAVEAFATLAAETAGSFIYQPEVNLGDDDNRQRFENTVFNVVQGAIGQSVTFIEPGVAARGGKLDVTVRGSQTNFRSTSSVSVSGTGVAVENVEVISPIEMRVTLNISASATQSFRDVRVETDLGGGNLEVASGIGSLQVADAPPGARIVGANPASVERGDTTTVRISGRNTSFDASSEPSFGSGVTVLSVSAVSPTTLDVRLRVEGTASIGFRDVLVRTGLQTAFELETGPFFVAPMGLEIPELVTISPGEAGVGDELTVTIDGANTAFTGGASELSFSGDGITVLSSTVLSATRLQAQIRVAAGASAGFRDVRVTTGSEVATLLGGFLVVEAPDECLADGETLCLNGNRFRITANWRDFDGNSGSARVVPFGADDSGLLWFFAADNWELLLKVLDGCGFNDRFWVFAAATTNVEIELQVTDTRTGQTRTYFNPLGNPAPALADTDAFATCDAAVGEPKTPSELQTVRMDRPNEGRADMPVITGEKAWEEASSIKEGTCADGPENLCLNGDRFLVEVTWRDFDSNVGTGRAVPFGSDDSGLLWFFASDNWEMLIKVLNGCAFNDRYWVFSAATTTVEYTMRVTDSMTGAVKEYFHPLGALSPALTDTAAFEACP